MRVNIWNFKIQIIWYLTNIFNKYAKLIINFVRNIYFIILIAKISFSCHALDNATDKMIADI